MTDVEKILCKRQGQLFEYVSDRGYDAASFAESFLLSDFCAVFLDTEYSRCQMAPPPEILQAYCAFEGGPSLVKTDAPVLAGGAAWWMWYTYRSLFLETGAMSRDLVKLVPAADMTGLYPVYHTLSAKICADNIIEAYRLPGNRSAEIPLTAR